jgi:hypothetical protein
MRTPAGLVLLLGLSALAAAPATAGPGKIVPAQIAQARYVCLGYDTGDGFLSEQQAILSPENVYPEDRHALDAIRDELAAWGKYVVTLKPRDAELLLAVRTGRRVGFSTGIGVGSGGAGGGFGGVRDGRGGVELSTPYDTLTVYESRGGQAGAQLWRVQRKGALSGTPPKAFGELRADVERTPTTTKKR